MELMWHTPTAPPHVYDWSTHIIPVHIAIRSLCHHQVGAVDIDSGWSTGFNNFIFDTGKYPNASSMVSDGVRKEDCMYLCAFIDSFSMMILFHKKLCMSELFAMQASIRLCGVPFCTVTVHNYLGLLVSLKEHPCHSVGHLHD